MIIHGLVWFGWVLWHINHFRLFIAKSSLYIYIRYIWFVFVGFYGILTIVGYLMPNVKKYCFFVHFLFWYCFRIGWCSAGMVKSDRNLGVWFIPLSTYFYYTHTHTHTHTHIYIYIYIYIYSIYIYIYKSKVDDLCRRWPEGSLFDCYYTKVYRIALLLSLDCSILPLILTL